MWNGQVLGPQTATGKFFLYPEHLAFSINTDGVPLFKSSSTSFWPVYLVVHNLPPDIRMNSENMILGAIWCGPKKPCMNALLGPLLKTIKSLCNVGVEVKTPSGLKVLRTKLLFGVFDMPAKAAVLDQKQFNGEFGCTTCLHPGTRLDNGNRIYHPHESAEFRTHETVVQDAVSAGIQLVKQSME